MVPKNRVSFQPDREKAAESQERARKTAPPQLYLSATPVIRYLLKPIMAAAGVVPPSKGGSAAAEFRHEDLGRRGEGSERASDTPGSRRVAGRLAAMRPFK